MAEPRNRISVSGAVLQDATDWCRWSVRTRAADRLAWESTYGLALPAERLHSVASATSASLWLGPDEWLVLIRPQNAVAFRDRCTWIDPAAAPASSIVEISRRNVGIALVGPSVPWILNSGCPLDLSNDAFPIGACTRTLFGKAEVVLWRREETVWHLECWRSFAPYVWSYLAHAAADSAAIEV